MVVLWKFVSGLIPRLTSAGDTGTVTCQREGDTGDWTSRLISFEIKRLIFPWFSVRFQPLSKFFVRKVSVSPMVLKNLHTRFLWCSSHCLSHERTSNVEIFANKQFYNLSIHQSNCYFSLPCSSNSTKNCLISFVYDILSQKRIYKHYIGRIETLWILYKIETCYFKQC